MVDSEISSGPLVKGVGFLGLFKFMKVQDNGEEVLRDVLAKLTPPASDFLGTKVRSLMDYPYSVFIELLRTMDELMGSGDLALCKKIGEFTADLDYAFFYGSREGVIKPRDLFRDCGVYWKSYYTNAGYMETVDPSPDNTVVRIYDFPDMDPAHCRLMEGWMAQAMVNTGVVWKEYHERVCTSQGGDYHEFWGKWTESKKAVGLIKKD